MMSTVSQDLLLLDLRQAVIAPSVLSKLRQSGVDYSSYLHFLAQDVALGLPALEWGDRLASDGILSVARECWIAAGLPQPRIDEKYHSAKESWKERTAGRIQELEHFFEEHRARLEHDTRGQVEALLLEAERQAEQDWYDLALETLGRARAILGQALALIGEERERDRVHLLRSIDGLWHRLADLDPFPSGTEGEKAVSRLLTTARQMLEQPQWDTRHARRLIDLAQVLCDGAELDPRAVASVLGEKYEEPKVLRPTIEREPPQVTETIVEALKEAARTEPVDAQQRQRQERSDRVHRSANYHRFNKNFTRAERLFREALQLWPGNEAAAKNFASMLQQIWRAEDSIAVLEEGVQHAQERLPFYNMLMNFCIYAEAYDKAREYAQRALRLCGDASAEIGVLASLITLETKIGNYDRALEHCETILRLNPRHEHFRKERTRLRALIAGAPVVVPPAEEIPIPEVRLEGWGELTLEVSPLLRQDFEDCELTKVSSQVLKSTSLDVALAEAERLCGLGVELDPSQPKERADYFLQAASLVLKVTGEGPVSGKVAKSLQKYLNTYTGAMGDYFLARGNLDSARAYYLEHMRLFERGLPFYTLYRLANYFQTYVADRIDLAKVVQKSRPLTKWQRAVVNAVATAVQGTPIDARNDLGDGLLKLVYVNLPVRQCLHALLKQGNHPACSEIESVLRGRAASLQLETLSAKSDELLTQLYEAYRARAERQEDALRYLLSVVSDRRRLDETEVALQKLTLFYSAMTATDQLLLTKVRDIAHEVQRYFEESRFEERDFLANVILSSVSRFMADLDEAPTYLGRAYFARVIYRFRRLVEEEHLRLRQVSLPELVPTVVKAAWLIPDRQRECHIEIANKGESAAQEVSIRILGSETSDYVDDPKPYPVPGGSIYARPHSATVAIPVMLQRGATSKDAVDLRVRLEYHDREKQKKKSDPIRLRLSLRDEVPFTPIDNPYRTGLPVREREMFVGRDQFVDELVREVTRRERTSAVVVYGQKRSGKTSILLHVGINIPDWVVPVYFSMQTVLMEEDMVPGMFYLIADEIARKCRERGLGDEVGSLTWEQLTSPPGPSLQFRMYLDRIRQLPDVRLVLLIDEFTELSARIDEGKIDRSVMKYLKSLIEQGFFSCVLSGIDNMPQVLKRYSNELAVSDPRFVGYLKHDPAAQLIERPVLLPDGRSRFISPQVVDEIIRVQLLSFTSTNVLGRKSSSDAVCPDYAQEFAQNPA